MNLKFSELNEAFNNGYLLQLDSKYSNRKIFTFTEPDGQTIAVRFNQGAKFSHLATKATKTWHVEITGVADTGKTGGKLKPFRDPMKVAASIIDAINTAKADEPMMQGISFRVRTQQPIERLTRLLKRATRYIRMDVFTSHISEDDKQFGVFFFVRQGKTMDDAFGWVKKTEGQSTEDALATAVEELPLPKPEPIEITIEDIPGFSTNKKVAMNVEKWTKAKAPMPIDTKKNHDKATDKLRESPIYQKFDAKENQNVEAFIDPHQDSWTVDAYNKGIIAGRPNQSPMVVKIREKIDEVCTQMVAEYTSGIKESTFKSLSIMLDDINSISGSDYRTKDAVKTAISLFLAKIDERTKSLYRKHSLAESYDSNIIIATPDKSDMADAVNNFTGSGYKAINQHITTGDSTKTGVEEQIANMDQAFKWYGVDAGKLKPRMLLFRGMKGVPFAFVDDIVRTGKFATLSFMSTSTKLAILESFGHGNSNPLRLFKKQMPDAIEEELNWFRANAAQGVKNEVGICFVIEPANVPVIIPGNMGEHVTECEYIVNRGTKFNAELLNLDNNVVYIKLTCKGNVSMPITEQLQVSSFVKRDVKFKRPGLTGVHALDKEERRTPRQTPAEKQHEREKFTANDLVDFSIYN